jgi:DNA-directed RNA polymerase specialized sigma24 family protein
MTVADLAGRCSQEMAKSRRREPADDRFCFELFRRAILLRDPDAWVAIVHQYSRLAQSWLGVPEPEAEALANEAFARLWQQITPDRFQHGFHHLAGVLAYLRKCAISVAITYKRRLAREQQLLALLQDLALLSSKPDPLLGLDTQELVARVRDCLADEQERLVISLSFEHGLKPKEIHQRHPGKFASPHEVSRIKERVLERLRRDPYLRRFWG